MSKERMSKSADFHPASEHHVTRVLPQRLVASAAGPELRLQVPRQGESVGSAASYALAVAHGLPF